MRILQLSKYYPPTKGGIELVAQMISKVHAELGDSVDIISFGQGNREYQGIFNETVTQINQDLFFISTPINLHFHRKFLQLVEERKIKKIYVHLPNPYMHHLLYHHRKVLKREGVILSAVYHSDLVNQKILGPIYNKYLKKTSTHYDEIICSSDKLWESSSVLSQLGNKQRQIVPFCVDHETGFSKRMAFAGKLLAIGRLVPYKGFEFLIKSINQTPYQLTIIGDGPLRKKLEAIKGPNVRLLGGVDENTKRQLLRESDALIVSSINRAEAYGMIIVEAFECGLPVVAADISSGVTFLVKNEERGMLFEIQSRDSLLEKIGKFEQDTALYQRCSQNGYQFYRDQLSYERFRDKILQLARA